MVKLTTEQNSIGTKAAKKKKGFTVQLLQPQNGLVTAANTLSSLRM